MAKKYLGRSDNATNADLDATFTVARGGTGRTSVTTGNLLLGAGTGAMTELAPGAAGGYVRSDGTAWARATGVAAADVQAGTFTGSFTFASGITVSSGTSAFQAVTATTVTASTRVIQGTVGFKDDAGEFFIGDSNGVSRVNMKAAAANFSANVSNGYIATIANTNVDQATSHGLKVSVVVNNVNKLLTLERNTNTLFEVTADGRVVVNQLDSDGAILELLSSDVGHGMTSIAGTTTYGIFKKAGADNGGLFTQGLSEAVIGYHIRGTSSADTAVRSNAATAPVYIEASNRSGAGDAALAADKNLVAFANLNTVRFILDSDGDSHQDVGTAWTNFDTHDDVALLNLLAAKVTRRNDPLREGFGRFLRQDRTELERVKLVTFNRNGHHFVNMSRLAMLHTGAIRQVGGRVQEVDGRVERLERAVIAALEGRTKEARRLLAA